MSFNGDSLIEDTYGIFTINRSLKGSCGKGSTTKDDGGHAEDRLSCNAIMK
jgi:hypothetical protein